MKKQSIILFSTLLSISSLSMAASVKSLPKDQVQKMLTDQTVTTADIATIDGQLVNNTFIGYFGKDGKIVAKFANKPATEPQNDQGTYVVKGDGAVCFTWENWNNGKEFCTYFYDGKNSFFIINAKGSFEALVKKSDIKSGNQLASTTSTETSAPATTNGTQDSNTSTNPETNKSSSTTDTIDQDSSTNNNPPSY